MACNTLVEPACHLAAAIVSAAASGITSDILATIAQNFTSGIRWIVEHTAAWWVQIPSPSLAGEPAVSHIQQWLLPVTAAVAIGGVIAAGLRMALTRRASPLLDVTGGLLGLTAATALGASIAALLLKAGDAWSSWVLQASTGGHFTERLIAILDLGGKAAPAVALIFGVIAIFLALAQAVLMLFRQAALIILAGVLPLAAAGSVAPMTRTWVRKVTAWMLALICYKPAAAAVYATAFTMIGSGRSPETALMGFVMLALSLVALPALMRFFTWTTGSIASAGGGGQLLGAAAMGAVAVGAMRSPPGGAASAAQDHAAYLNSRLGPPPDGGASPPGGPPAGPGPGGPGSSGTGSGTGPATAASVPATPGMNPSARTGPVATGAAPASAAGAAANPATGAAGASSTTAAPAPAAGPAAAGSGSAAAGAAAAGPAGTAAAAAAAQAARSTTRLATGAMEEGDTR